MCQFLRFCKPYFLKIYFYTLNIFFENKHGFSCTTNVLKINDIFLVQHKMSIDLVYKTKNFYFDNIIRDLLLPHKILVPISEKEKFTTQ